MQVSPAKHDLLYRSDLTNHTFRSFYSFFSLKYVFDASATMRVATVCPQPLSRTYARQSREQGPSMRIDNLSPLNGESAARVPASVSMMFQPGSYLRLKWCVPLHGHCVSRERGTLHGSRRRTSKITFCRVHAAPSSHDSSRRLPKPTSPAPAQTLAPY